MELQAHISGQVPNQAASQLPGLAQPNGNALPTQIPNLAAIPDTEFIGARKHMQEKIYDILLQRLQHPVAEYNKLKYKDFAKRLEESLLKSAPSKEEHLNMETLENRLKDYIKRLSTNNHNQQYPQHVSSSPIGTMIPTPGMPHVVNSNVAATSVDASMIVPPGYNSMASLSVNSGSMFPTDGLHGNSLSRSDGLSNGYQPSSSSFSVGSGGTMSSRGERRIASQMIPTPAFTGSNNSHMNAESSDNNSDEEGIA